MRPTLYAALKGLSLPVSLPPAEAAGVVARLRAAGCVFAEDEADLLFAAADTPAVLDAMVQRRVDGLPLEQVVGWAEFCGLRIAVEPGVFVPRPRTEFLVREAVALTAPGAVVVDLCCGTGAVGAALLSRVPGIELYATDIDARAVRCAARNLAASSARVSAGDLFESLPNALRGRVDVLLCNAPYVPSDAIAFLPAEARDHEPLVALDGGSDGLDVHRRVAAAAPDWLAPRGSLLIETTDPQAAVMAAVFAAHGLSARTLRSEEFSATVVIADR
ncbi:MAG: release factor glutamine methyltransferase [Frankiaceae bacterium]|nr:release factor glutamine methyltransferase [Frankiaceae bacterium]